jgi:hypothetical protein
VRHITDGASEEIIREISVPRAEPLLAHSRFHVRTFIRRIIGDELRTLNE